MLQLPRLKQEMMRQSQPKKAQDSAWFFKTKPGEYGHGDQFLGLTVPEQRVLAKQFRDLSLSEVTQLLHSKIHEHRLTAIFILVSQYERGDARTKKKIVDLYLRSTKYINNWDIVDSSAPYILGDYLLDRPRRVLYQLASSPSLWERRIAIIATQTFIRNNQYADTLRLAKRLVSDPEDLIHKAVGWMLREVGDRDRAAEERFLKVHAQKMPRTMLRYAIEKLPSAKRNAYLRMHG